MPRVGAGPVLLNALREAKAAGVIRLNNNRRCHMGECCEICMPGRGCWCNLTCPGSEFCSLVSDLG